MVCSAPPISSHQLQLLSPILGRAQVLEALMGPFLVVLADPLPDRLTGFCEVGEHVLPDALLLETPEETLVFVNRKVDHPSSLARRLTPALLALPESVGLLLEDQDVAVVGKPVKESGGEDRIPEHLTPAGELEVRGDDDRSRLVALREELEEERSPGPEFQIPDFVHDDQVHLLPGVEVTGQPVLVLGEEEFLGQGGGAREADPGACVDGGQAHGLGHMRLPGPARSEQDDVLPVSYTHLTLPTNREV